MCLSSTCSSHWQITIRVAGWSGQRLFFGQKSRSLFWWKHVHGRTRQLGSFMLLLITPSPLHPTLPDDHGNDTPHELIHHRQSGLLQQHPRQSTEATARSNTVGPQRRGANYLWSHAVRPYHANSEKEPQRIEFKRCLLVYKALHGQAPAYIASFCSEVSSTRHLRSSSHHRLQIPPLAKTVKLGERSFAIGEPSEWNNLPDAVKESENLKSFKQRLKTHLFSICYSRPM